MPHASLKPKLHKAMEFITEPEGGLGAAEGA